MTPELVGLFGATYSARLGEEQKREAKQWLVPVLEGGLLAAARRYMEGCCDCLGLACEAECCCCG